MPAFDIDTHRNNQNPVTVDLSLIHISTYKGKLLNFEKASFTKNGTYSVVSEGKVEMHGVSQNFHAPVEMIVKDGIVTFKCTFNVKADDYKIDIPALVKPKLLENTPINTVISFKI